MFLDLDYNNENFVGLTIEPTATEDADTLHNYANNLVLKNPAITFSEMAKAGLFNDMSDEDYKVALENVKLVSSEFFESKPEVNIFHVLDRALCYFLNQDHSIKTPGIKS
jgi:hypothetical protein